MLASREKAVERLMICKDCPRLFKPTWTCRECGCFMKAKARIENQVCPLGKWKDDE